MKHTKSYIPNYPRPLMSRSNWINLEGYWDFLFDEHNIGLQNAWNKNFPSNSKSILVPYSYHTEMSGIFDESYHPYMWYRRNIHLNQEIAQRILIHFEAVDYACELYINKTFVGSHTGGYNRFSFDITRYIRQGDNEIILYVKDDLSKEKPRGKQRYKKENFECWYVETSGIWKTPWIEYVNVSYIKDMKYTYDDQYIDYHLDIENFSHDFCINIDIFDEDSLLIKTTSRNSKDIRLTIPKNIIKWDERHPKLYDVLISISKDDLIYDQVKSYIGIRDIKYNKHIIINDYKPYFKMILDQGYFGKNHLTAHESDIVKDLLLIQEMGFNAIRKHEKLESQIYNYYCDILGIYTWQEMPSFYEYSDLSKKRFKAEYKEMLNQYLSHPSIVAWVPFNESWGITDILTNKNMQEFTEEIYHLTKSIDISRPVVTNDGWEHTLTDIVTFHNYQEYGDGLLNTYQDIDKILRNESTHPEPPKKAFANGYTYKKQPLMMTEFAGIAFNDENGWGYGACVNDKEAFMKRLNSLVEAIKYMNFFQGYCVTQLTDVQQEVNGLLKEDRTFKIDLEEIKKIII